MSLAERLDILERTVAHQGQSVAALTMQTSTQADQIASLIRQVAELRLRLEQAEKAAHGHWEVRKCAVATGVE